MTMQDRIDEKMIKRQIAYMSYNVHFTNPELYYNDPELRSGLNYEIHTDIECVYIYYKDKFIHHILKPNDLSMSLDDFGETILLKMIIELRDSFNTYDDAGQII